MKRLFPASRLPFLRTIKDRQRWICRTFVLGLMCVVLNGCDGHGEPADQEVAPVPVSLVRAQHIKRFRTISVSGTVVSPNAPVHVSFLVAGRAEKVLPREGDFVAAGQILAALDPSDYRSACDSATAQTAQARVAADQAEREFSRMAFLFAQKSLARNDFEKFKAARDAAALKLDQALAAEKVHRKHLSDTRLHAPVSGFVSKRLLEPGQAVAEGVPAFALVQLDPVEILVGVPETDIHLAAIGQKAAVTLSALPELHFEGTVSAINVSADPGTHTYMTRISVANAAHLIRIGMVAEVEIFGDEQLEAITLPVEAIVQDHQGAPLVYVYYPEQNRAYSKRVTVGTLIGNEVEIRDGLSGNEQIVIAGQDKLRDGAAVAVVNRSAVER